MVRLPLRATLHSAIPLTLLCQCISDDTLKAVGPFYLVSMPGEVKDPTSPHWNVYVCMYKLYFSYKSNLPQGRLVSKS